MSLPTPLLSEFKNYLKKEFACKEDWQSSILDGTVEYELVRKSIAQMMKTDPDLHRLMAWMWQSNRSRTSIADTLFLDPSTLKRKQDRACCIVLNYINNGDLCVKLEAIDILQREAL